MNEPSIFFNEVNERQGVFTRRVFLMGGLTGIGIGALTGRLAQLQLIQNENYRQLSDKNQYNFRLIVPPRDVAAYVAAIEALAGDPQRRARMGAAAREASAAYSWDAASESVARVYRALHERGMAAR